MYNFIAIIHVKTLLDISHLAYLKYKMTNEIYKNTLSV